MFLFRTIIKYVWPQIKKYKLAFYSIFIIFGLRIVLNAIIKPIYFKKIIDILSIENVNHSGVSSNIFSLVFIMIGITFFTLFLARFGKFVHFSFEINIIRELRNFAFKKIENHSQTFFANTFSGSLVTKSRRFVGSFETMFDVFLYDLYAASIILVGTLIVLSQESLIITSLFIVFVAVFLIIVFFFLNKKIKYDLIEAEADSRVSGRMADVFGNILAVKIFSGQNLEDKLFNNIVIDAAKKSKKAWFFGLKLEVFQGILITVAQSLILYVMIHLWVRNEISTGTVVLIQMYMVIIFDRLWDLNNSLTRFMKSAADMKEMVDIFEITPDILDPKNPEQLKIKEGNIIFKDVSFKYSIGQEVLINFNLDIKSGERVGLVGYSGAGKSTITKLLLRFNDVVSGSITIDGQNIKNITQDDLRSIISYVPQEPILFHRTIKENILYGKPLATHDEVIEVSKKAHAHDFIDKLPYKYETKVGERGVKLSGGERQRVAIARAMLKDSPILMLDEATSSLDSLSESYIQEALQILMKDKTTIVIAHRLSTIQKMDRIIVLDNGKIVEEGTHKDLLAKDGIYAELWNHQSGGFIE